MPPLLEAQGLHLSRRGEAVLYGQSLSIHAGQWFDLLGPSGCGKSTFLQCLARLLPISNGEAKLNGQARNFICPTIWRRQVVYVDQHPVAVAETVREDLLFPFSLEVCQELERPSDDELHAQLCRVGLSNIGLETSTQELSGGQLARVCFLRAALINPKILLLDEPEAMLDEDSASKLGNYLAEMKAAGCAIVRVSHRPSGDADQQLKWEDLGGHSSN